jgi:Amt family ammonium transporter
MEAVDGVEVFIARVTTMASHPSAETNVAVLRRLADAGVHMLIDDFGNGYSSLSYLHRFSVDTLKIDRSFVELLAGAEENIEIIRTIITLARALGMSVIAEGVETEDQHKRLMELDCEEVQGFLFSQAVDVRTAEELLGQSR